ncbi:MAG: UDP-3-O-(3-hydroxymyristoyl)glucosamine N-acyltransferase, partial [Proteobacteria bacterium]|nr:UDP-3-O-(3-hydroxymyristoyl)glucosamine N-acyltransferase [Burkholderiales bacterium]
MSVASNASGVVWRLSDLVARLGGVQAGAGDPVVTGIASLAGAGAGSLSFFAHSRHRQELAHTRASAVIVAEADREATALPRIVTANPYAYYARAARLLDPVPPVTPGIHATASVE